MNLVYDIHSIFQQGFINLTMNGMHSRLASNQAVIDIYMYVCSITHAIETVARKVQALMPMKYMYGLEHCA